MTGGSDEGEVSRAGDARVAALEAALAAREARIVEQDARIVEQDARIVEQDARIAALTTQVAKLTELLGRNSSNSHLPPSSNGPGASSRGGTAGQPQRTSKVTVQGVA